MLRTLLIISLVFCLSLFSNMSYVYAPCRPGHGDGGGDSGRPHSGGGGGGMNNAAGAAAAFGLLFNVLQSTRAQEDDAGIDIDALAAEYATAFNLMDPTVSLELNSIVILQSGSVNNELIASEIVVIEECSCGGDKCTCPKKDACGVLFWKKAVSDWVDKFWGDFWEYNPDSEAVAVFEDTLRDYEERLNKAEEKCNIPSGGLGGGTGVAIATSEDTPVCGCGGGACKCPREDACQVQYYGDRARSLEARNMDAIPGSYDDRQVREAWNDYKRMLELAEKTCNTPGSASSGGTGVAIDEPPPEDTPVCRCDTDGCACPNDGACFVSTMTGAALYWSEKAMDATPGSEEAREYADKWNLSREELEKRLKECKGEIPRSDPPGFKASSSGDTAVGTPALGTPALGTPSMGTPATGTPGTTAIGGQALGTPAIGTPALGTPSMGTPATGTPGTTAIGGQALGTPALGSPVIGGPSIGTPATGTPALGGPVIGGPAVGTPYTGTPAIGTPALGTPSMGGPPVIGVPLSEDTYVCGCPSSDCTCQKASDCSLTITHNKATDTWDCGSAPGGDTGVATPVPPSEDTYACGCPASDCTCQKASDCSLTITHNKATDTWDCGSAPGGDTGGSTPIPLSEDAPGGCGCPASDCTCQKASDCSRTITYNKATDKWDCGSAPGGGTGVSATEPLTLYKLACGCGGVGNNCACTEKVHCDLRVTYNKTTGNWDCGGGTLGGTGVATDEPPSEGTPVCNCGGGGCTCPKALSCGGPTYNKTTHIWDCGSAPGGETGVATPVPPSEDAIACSCGGDGCKCQGEFTCSGAYNVVHWDEESGGILSTEWVCEGVSGGGTLD